MAKRHEAEVAAEILRRLGLDPGMASEQVVEVLRATKGRSQANDAAIAKALGFIPIPSSAELLSEMERDASGDLRREVRRALFKLRQRGIEPPTTVTRAQPPPPPPAGTGLSALLSPIDSEGARIAWIIKPRPQGGMARLWGLTSEVEGLVGATLVNLSSRQLRAERREIERRASIRLAEADWRLADFVLCEAYRHTPEQRRGQVGNFLTIRAEIIGTPPPIEFQHPIYDEFAAELQRDPSVDLLKEPELAGWRLPADRLKPYAEEIKDLRNSPLVLNQLQQEDRISSVIERAIDELFSGDLRERVRRRFEDTAYYLVRSGRRQAAGWAAAAAARVRDGGDLKRERFFQSLLRANLESVLAHQAEQERQEPRFIMTPAEMMRERQHQHGRQR